MSKKHARKKLFKEQKIEYGFVPILTGSDLSSRRLAIMKAESRHKGPVVWLTGVVHGDEVGGAAVIQELFAHFRTHPLTKGAVYAFPLLNPFGFESASRHISMTEQDLNRSFPGNPEGTVSERLAYTVFQTIVASRPAVVLDLHNDWTLSIPYVLIDVVPGILKFKTTRKKMERFALASGLLAIEDRESKMHELVTISGSLMQAGIPALTFELGESYVVNEKNVRDGVAAVWNILRELAMVPISHDLPTYFELPVECRDKTLKYHEDPRSTTSGLIRYLTKPGALVKKGEPFAKIYNVFGKLEETLYMEADGIAIAYRDSAVVFPGIAVAAFGIFKHR